MAVDRTVPAGGRRTVYDDRRLLNLLPALGVRVLIGVHYYPQFDLWRIDPEKGRQNEYNRFAQVVFALSTDPAQLTIETPTPDMVVVGLQPAHPALVRLECDFLLCASDDRRVLSRQPSLALIDAVGRFRIYRAPANPKPSG